MIQLIATILLLVSHSSAIGGQFERRFTFAFALAAADSPVKVTPVSKPAKEVEEPKPKGGWFDAISEARESGLPVVVYFTTENCINCRKLEKGPFENAAVVVEQQEIAWVKAGPAEAKAWKVRSYPELVFVSRDWLIISRLKGLVTAKQIVAECERIRDGPLLPPTDDE